MATIRKTESGWRVELYRLGHRASKSFKTKAEAQTWARSFEDQFQRHTADLPRKEHGAPPVALHLDEEAIVQRSKPYVPICGVYFLIEGGRVVYVGQSVDVHTRIAQHVGSKAFDAIHVIPCSRSELLDTEATYIRRLNPPLNRVGKLLSAYAEVI